MYVFVHIYHFFKKRDEKLILIAKTEQLLEDEKMTEQESQEVVVF